MLARPCAGAPRAADAGADPGAAASGARRRAGGAAARARACRWRSAPRASRSAPDTDVYLADTLGEMGLWYRVASVSFVGGSLVDGGRAQPVRAGAARQRHPARAARAQLRRRLPPAPRRPARRSRCASEAALAEALVATHGAGPRRGDGRRRLGRLQRGRRGHRRGARRRSAGYLDRRALMQRAAASGPNPPARPGLARARCWRRSPGLWTARHPPAAGAGAGGAGRGCR